MHIRHTATVYRKYYYRAAVPVHRNKEYHEPKKFKREECKREHKHYRSVDHLQWKFAPISDVASSYHIYKELIPRTAYYGSRYISGRNQEVVVVLAEVSAAILEQNLIMSCLLGSQYSTTVRVVRDPLMRWIQKNKRGYTHFFALIYCFNLEPNTIVNNVVRILYRTEKRGIYRSVDTEKPLRLLNNASHVKAVNSVVVCATMYGHPLRFEEWLRYQKTIGVDRIHLSVQVSFVSGIERYPFLIESLANGFVELEVWKHYLRDDEVFYHSQSLIYQDCVMHYQSTFEYAAMVDYDDFFIPVIPSKKDIHYYINHVFDEITASIKLPWIELPCEVKNYTFLVDGNVTQMFGEQDTRIKRTEFKSIHRLSAVDVVSIHQVYKMIPGYVQVQVTGVDFSYFAHIRPRSKFCTVNS
jgi:hypothetical protein